MPTRSSSSSSIARSSRDADVGEVLAAVGELGLGGRQLRLGLGELGGGGLLGLPGRGDLADQGVDLVVARGDLAEREVWRSRTSASACCLLAMLALAVPPAASRPAMQAARRSARASEMRAAGDPALLSKVWGCIE